VMELVE